MALIRFAGRILLLPVKLALALVGVTFRTGVKAGAVPARLSVRSVRLVGLRGWIFFVLGLAVGLLFAPGPGRELRARLQALMGPPGVGDAELAAKVTFELAHAPRTWHLPQPNVQVAAGVVTLTGAVGDDGARAELARVAGAIPGVASVINQIGDGAAAAEPTEAG